MNNIVLFSIIFFVAILISGQAKALNCKGEACGSISFVWKDGCLTLKNLNSSRVVKVVFPSGPGISKVTSTLKPGQRSTLKLWGACIGTVRLPAKAEYQ